MKNQILIFLLGVFVTISLAFTTNVSDILTVRPALPKQTMVIDYNSKSECVDGIKYYISKGFIVKSVGGTSQYGGEWILVMEKY